MIASPSAYAGTQVQETVAIGAGGVLVLYGLKLIRKSTKKKGTLSQTLIGAAAALGGGYIATHGPKYIRHKGSKWFHYKWLNWAEDTDYKRKKEFALRKYNEILNNNNSSLATKALCWIYTTALKCDSFEMIPVEEL